MNDPIMKLLIMTDDIKVYRQYDGLIFASVVDESGDLLILATERSDGSVDDMTIAYRVLDRAINGE